MDNNALTAGLYLLDEIELIMNANRGVFRKEKSSEKNILLVPILPFLCSFLYPACVKMNHMPENWMY